MGHLLLRAVLRTISAALHLLWLHLWLGVDHLVLVYLGVKVGHHSCPVLLVGQVGGLLLIGRL